MRLGLALRELEQVERAFDVDGMRRDRRELGAGRKQRREMKDELDLELGEDALEHAAIENRARDLAVDLAGDRRFETGDVEGDDGAVRLAGEALDETVTDLAAGAGDEHDWFPHPRIILNPP